MYCNFFLLLRVRGFTSSVGLTHRLCNCKVQVFAPQKEIEKKKEENLNSF
ncbi:hypothetical protein F8388_013930 [Cannabis sativa]|uniref:Uncharacterized protein n=1 Tax=Cannabis sativa TaxID=3483 RepID=A0A7J6FQF1_CANSA|nr:hypothetical protein F8388_013930 [Cannabis sativa]KAF4372020.1 hypothetical protein G4B88_001520 [Cannabis sativa]